MRTAFRPSVSAVVALLLAALTLPVMAPAPASAATASASLNASFESEFLELINRERRAAGLRTLASDSQARLVARDWSFQMAADAKLYHRPKLSDAFVGRWTRLGENVGVGPSVARLHTAFMDSPGHRANVLGNFERAGIGVVVKDGRIWVTVNFISGESTVRAAYHADHRLTGSRFADVATGSTFYNDIVWLADADITTGCASGQFCPDRTVTRGQMAAFLSRALDLPAGTAKFSDVPAGSTFASDIAALARAGVTQGCGTGRFCPADQVTRGQMAAFLSRALDLPASKTRFSDVPASLTFASEIGALADAGITQGCSAGRFCPNAPVTRGQMAAFLRRALG